MSDLQCPCRVIVVRHAEAQYGPTTRIGSAASLTPVGRARAQALAETLRARRVAAILSSSLAESVHTAEIVASELRLHIQVRAGLDECLMVEPARRPYPPDRLVHRFGRSLDRQLRGGTAGAETPHDVVLRFREEIEDIADRFRGETVLVITHGGVMSLALPRLADNVPGNFAQGAGLQPCALVEVDVDADGWRCRSWSGQPM